MFKEFGGPRTGITAHTIYQKHLKKIRNPEKKVPNEPPVLDVERIFKVATIQADASALGRMEEENRKLVRAINIIYRTKGKIDTESPNHAFLSNYNERKSVNKWTYKKNVDMYRRILNVQPNYRTRETEVDYAKMRKEYLRTSGKDPNMKPLRVSEEWSIIPAELTIKPDPSRRVKCFFDIRAKHERKGELINMGRIHIDVYRDLAPIAGENFIRLCRGDNKLSYKGTIIHKVFPGKLCLGGDTQKRRGLGGVSAFGFPIPNEDPILEFAGPGVFGSFTPEPGKNTSQFLISFKEMKALKKKYTAFGKVVFGRALEMVEEFGTKSGFPLMEIKIVRCGILWPESEKTPRHGPPSIPTELIELTEKIKNEEDRERRQRLDFEEKQQFYKKYGFLTQLDPEIPYPPFPWKLPKMEENPEEMSTGTAEEEVI